MYFNSSVIPLSAVLPPGEIAMVGSGFLVKADEQTYLVTAAHVANNLVDQYAEWSQWAQVITFHDQLQNPLGQVALFGTDDDGNRTPAFKYGRAADDTHRILDLIMVPLPATDPLLASFGEFRPFETVSFRLNDPVVIAGCHDWPRINTKNYFLRGYSPDLIVLHIDPPSQKGESGGPVLSLSGELLGVNYGARDTDDAPGPGLVLNAELLRLVHSGNEGFLEGQKRPE